MRQTLRISIHVQLTLLLNSTWPCVEVCYDDEEQRQEGKTFVCLSRVFNSPSPFLTRLISQICNPLLRFSSR